MRKPRTNYTPPEKVSILRRHLIDRVPISDLCDEYRLSPTHRVVRDAGLMKAHNNKPSLKGKGFVQPLRPHEHCSTSPSRISTSPGRSSPVAACSTRLQPVHCYWEIRESMAEAELEPIIQRARERFPDVRPRIISDNGPQFIAKDFKEFIRICGMTHVRISPYYPQSNEKMERLTLNHYTCLFRPFPPVSVCPGSGHSGTCDFLLAAFSSKINPPDLLRTPFPLGFAPPLKLGGITGGCYPLNAFSARLPRAVGKSRFFSPFPGFLPDRSRSPYRRNAF